MNYCHLAILWIPILDSCSTLALCPKKSMDTFDKWLAAWSNYELLLVKHGYSYVKLTHHQATIQHINRKYHWSVIYTYDIKYRLACADFHFLDFSQKSERLYNAFSDASTLKPDYAHCYRFKSTDHTVIDCPFPVNERVEAKMVPIYGTSGSVVWQ